MLPWDYGNVRFMGPSFGLWKLRGRLLIVEVSGKGMKLGGFICFGWVHPQRELEEDEVVSFSEFCNFLLAKVL